MMGLDETVATRAERDGATIEAILERGGPRLAARMARSEAYLEQVTAESGAPLAVYATATIRAGGKRLRPLLVLLSAESAPRACANGVAPEEGNGSLSAAEGESGHEQALVRAAAAVELMHSATLVHDDVIDGASLRRGRPTVAVQGGPHAAIATGDLLFSRAFAELARNGDSVQLRALSDASSALVRGEFLQREDAFSRSVSVDRYIERCELKTAALFEASCRLGTLVAGGGGALAGALGSCARRVGLAFQLLDDVLDVSGSPTDTGKVRGTDLLDGTVTLPLILARERDPELSAVDLRELSGPGQADQLCERIAATGALERARALALEVVGEAKTRLPAGLPARLTSLLQLVADAVVDRYR
ncbi:MAG: polyprenyl synthetase family protein [Acidobacteriota bacterium]|nr:polyprenyl synthetase family protein [Acidobacteriota bacterium]